MSRPVVIITGASRGIGAEAARSAACLGADVVLTARSAGLLGALAAEIAIEVQLEGGAALAVPAEITDEDGCREVVRRTLARFGRIDALINNAGLLEPVAPVAQADYAAWQRAWQVNLLAPLMLTHLALPHLRAARGRVINVSTGASARGVPGWAAYTTAKAALNQLTRTLAAEEPLITCVAVRPGKVDTGMQQAVRELGAAGMPPDLHRQFVELYERGELLPPDKPARALAWLALHAPAHLSGQFIEWDAPEVEAE